VAQAHDLFRRGGPGKDTFRVWSHLDTMAPVRATVLTETLNRTRRTVYYHLEKLQVEEVHRVYPTRPTRALPSGRAILERAVGPHTRRRDRSGLPECSPFPRGRLAKRRWYVEGWRTGHAEEPA
jgi:hypothetical protein